MAKQLLEHFQSKILSAEQRKEVGKAIRKKVPHSQLGNYKPTAKRADPVAILIKQGKTRLPELVPIRYARMLTSPFAFLRGAAAIMAEDLAANPPSSGLLVQACGDMHIANFGVFASAERNLIFGINDFDETLPAPWEWDMKRLVASIAVGGKFLGADKKLCEKGIRTAVKYYRRAMNQYADKGRLELWYTTIKEQDILERLPKSYQKAVKKVTDKARKGTHLQVLSKLADIVDEKYRLRDDAPFIVHETKTKSGKTINEALAIFLESYFESLADDRKNLLKHYRIVDVARKIVGVGSVGTRCWIVFLSGGNQNDPLFLQVKEAQPSVLDPHASRSAYKNHGERVVAGQRLIQGAPDIFLGWGELDGFHFYVRQLRDMKGGAELTPETVNLKNLPLYCALCAWAMALAHAKGGDAATLSGYIGKKGKELEDAFVSFAFAYSDQTDKDHKALSDAAKSGRIKVANKAS
jgi:uncharacterized protein (DUF2252 family)